MIPEISKSSERNTLSLKICFLVFKFFYCAARDAWRVGSGGQRQPTFLKDKQLSTVA